MLKGSYRVENRDGGDNELENDIDFLSLNVF